MKQIDTLDISQWVKLSNGTFTLPHCVQQFEKELQEDRDYQAKWASKAPYKPGDIVYLKSMAGDHHLPTKYINKPFTVKSCTKTWHIDNWDLDLEDCEGLIFASDVVRTKPF
jgi:hypothetical protein